MTLEEIIKEVYHKKHRNLITFLTGAGISSDSGIPTYRGSDGIWIKGTKHHKPEEFGTKIYFDNHQEEVWQYTLHRKKIIDEAKPNSSHKTIARIEKNLEDRFQLITQNVDNLHQRAGSKRIYEIHGNYQEVKCSEGCKPVFPIPVTLQNKELLEDIQPNEIESLKCPNCGGWLRPNILWFDECYDEYTNKKFSALKAAKNTGILFIIGTSGATSLPLEIAKTTIKYGGYVVDLNIEDNHFTKLLENNKRKLSIRLPSREVLPKIEQYIKDASID